MLTGSCLRKALSQPCDIDYTIVPTLEPAVYCVTRPEKRTTNVVQKIVDGAVGSSLSTEAKNSSMQQLHSLNLYLYCAPCPCLIWTAMNILKTPLYFKRGISGISVWIRIDPRLRVDCCSSLLSGIERLKNLQEEIDDLLRRQVMDTTQHIDFFWIDRVVFVA